MDFMVNIDVKKLPVPVRYTDKILLMGSCFTEHIGNSLSELKFDVLQNPNGILFDPVSVAKSLISYIDNKKYTEEELFELNGVWHSWNHHSRFSNIDRQKVVANINASQEEAHNFLKVAEWIIITLGSSYSYQLTDPGSNSNKPVANCHRAPAQRFNKHLLEIDETTATLDQCYHQLLRFNPHLNIIFTVSPVRHIRDGVVENNRSKARLIEAVHHLVNRYDRLFYFPAYELVIDVLRDYRFYDADLVHPNYMATTYVLEKFAESCIDPSARLLMEEVRKIVIARKHKAFHPAAESHRQFLLAQVDKAKELISRHPHLKLDSELRFFEESLFL